MSNNGLKMLIVEVFSEVSKSSNALRLTQSVVGIIPSTNSERESNIQQFVILVREFDAPSDIYH